MQNVSTPTTSSKWRQLVARMPRPDPEDRILKNVEEGQVEKIAAELLAGGREAVAALVGMLAEPGAEGSDSPARHALHALVIHAGGQGDAQRRAVAAALASTLTDAGRPAGVRSFVVQQLELCADRAVAPALGALLADDQLYADAAMALLSIGGDGARDQFRAALGDATGPRRVAVIQALGTLRDAASADALRRTAARDPDPTARHAAAWALGNIGDPESAGLLTDALARATGHDRIEAANACLLLLENLARGGRTKEADALYERLRTLWADPADRHLLEAAGNSRAAAST